MNGRTGRMVFVTALYIIVGPIFVLFALGFGVYLCFKSKHEFGKFYCKEIFKKVVFDGLRDAHEYYMTYVNYGQNCAVEYLVDYLKDESE